MPRKHLFAVVVLLGAAAVAGLLALTRTQPGATATRPSSAQIAARTRSLDQLEASLRRSLAKRPPAVSSTGRSAPTRTVYVRSSAAVQTGGGHEDEHGGDDQAYEQEHEHEGADD